MSLTVVTSLIQELLKRLEEKQSVAEFIHIALILTFTIEHSLQARRPRSSFGTESIDILLCQKTPPILIAISSIIIINIELWAYTVTVLFHHDFTEYVAFIHPYYMQVHEMNE